MIASKTGVVVVIAVVYMSTVVTVGAAAPSSTTAVNNTTTSTTTVSTPTTTTSTTTTTEDESLSEQAKKEVEDAIDGGQSTSEEQKQGCIEITTDSGNTTTTECIPRHYQKIDNTTEVLAVDWNSEVVTIVIESKRPQQITVTDPYSVDKDKRGGHVNFVDETVGSGQSVIRIRASEKSGDKELWIGTSRDLAYIRSPGKPFLANGLRTSLLYMAGLGGGIGTILVMITYVKYRARKMKNGWTDVLEDYKP